MNPTDLSIVEAAALIQARKLSPVELTQAYLERIERLNPLLNAYITVTAEMALAAARAAEAEIMRRNYRGVLHGIPLAIKDNIDVAGVPTTAGSSFLRDNVPQEDADVVAALKQAGAIILGKTNMHEWAFGVINKNPFYGDTRNPWDTARITGGSSGGSAAAVAARLCAGALGTDTRGSVRTPAALCGCVGYKPSYGSVPMGGVVPLSHTLDHIGMLARTTEDAQLLYESVRNYSNVLWMRERREKVKVWTVEEGWLTEFMKNIRIAIPASSSIYFGETSVEIARSLEYAAALFRTMGATVEEIDLDWLREMWEASRVISSCDAAAYHAERLAQNPDGFGADVLPRLREGQGYSGVDYSNAKRIQATHTRRFGRLFSKYYCFLLPTLPIAAPRHDDPDGVADARLRFSAFNAPFNMTGNPSRTVPCGFDMDGLPIGMQLISRRAYAFERSGVAVAYERATDWHKRPPPL
jgi:aspartyl-tRNA(Asn)/glutamyl-tRNA(Gln) amidotransferase subunit A